MVPGVLHRIAPLFGIGLVHRCAAALFTACAVLAAPGYASATPAPACWLLDVPSYPEPRESLGVDDQLRGETRIVNACPDPVALTLRQGRTVTGADGQLAWSPETDPAAGLRLDSESVTVAPGSSTALGFTVHTALDAAPGEHPIALAAAVDGASSDIVRWQSIPVRVEGEQRTEITITEVTPGFGIELNPFAPGTADIGYTLTNTGTATVTGRVLAGLAGLYSLRADAPARSLPTVTLVPGATYRGTVRIESVWPAARFDAQVGFWPTAVGGAPVTYAAPAVISQRTLWAPPIGQVVAVLLVGVALFVAALTRRDRHVRRARAAASA